MPSYGPIPSTAQDVGTWSGPSLTRLLDGNNATSTADNVTPRTLNLHTFGFTIPSTERVIAIGANIWAWQPTSLEQRVAPRLYIGGVAVGTAAPYVTPSLTFAPVTNYPFLGDAAYWGLASLPTPAQINAANFGLQIVNTSGTGAPTHLVAVDLATLTIVTVPQNEESMRLNQRPWRKP